MPDTTETIVIKWIVDAKDVLTKYEAVKKATAEIKAQMQEMAQKTGASLKELSTLMENAFKKDIQTRFPLGGKEAEDALNTYKLAMTSAVNQIKSEAAQEARVIKETQQQERDARRQTAKSLEADVRQQVAAMKQLESEAAKSGKGGGGGIGGILGSLLGGGGGALGSILPSLLGIAGGIGIITSQFRKFSAAVSDAAQSGVEFARAMYSMEIGIRALQRTGVDITIQDAYEQLRILRKDFGIFTTKDLVVGSAAFFNLNRDMGFTKEQLFELQRAIATLAVVNSRSMDEVQKTVALALSSGYTEGLQRLGVSINRVTIAAEAASMGWKGGYTSLTEQQRALATYNLIIQKTSVYQEDLLEYQKTLPGILDKTTAAIEEQRNTLGSYLTGIKVIVEKLKLWWQTIFIMNGPLGALARTVKVLGYLFENFGDIARNVAHRLKDFLPKDTLDNIYSFIVMFLQGMTAIRGMIETVTTAILKMNDAVGTLIFGDEWPFFKKTLEDLRDIAKGLPVEEEMAGGNISKGDEEDYALRHRPTEEDAKALEAIQNQEDAITAIEEDAAEQRQENIIEHQRREAEIKEEHHRRLEEMEIEHKRRLEKLEIDHQRKLEDIQRNYVDKLADIDIGVEQDREDAARKYEQDVEDTWSDYYNRLAQAAEDYRNKQLDAEAAFQEKMRKLREGFLFDLEDALRVRDARQVLNLIRRYNLEKTQTEREYEQQKEKMARDYQQQLAELARQRDERLRMLAEELQRRYEEIAREAERERRKAEEDAARAKADEERRLAQEKIDEQARYDQDKADELARYYQDWADEQARYKQQEDDLQRHIDTQLAKIAKAIGDEIGYTVSGVAAVTKALNSLYGPGGNAEKILNYYVALVATRMAQANALMSGTNLTPNLGTIKPIRPPSRRRAQGGIDIASSATDVTFGETGYPELHLFMPLSKSMRDLGQSITGFSGKNGKGRVAVEILLSKDLEGRIIDTTMDTVADVIIRRLR